MDRKSIEKQEYKISIVCTVLIVVWKNTCQGQYQNIPILIIATTHQEGIIGLSK